MSDGRRGIVQAVAVDAEAVVWFAMPASYPDSPGPKRIAFSRTPAFWATGCGYGACRRDGGRSKMTKAELDKAVGR